MYVEQRGEGMFCGVVGFRTRLGGIGAGGRTRCCEGLRGA